MAPTRSPAWADAASLRDLPWPRVAERLRRDARLLVPVGTCVQHGPHLPLSTDTLIVDRLAAALSARSGVLVAPTLPFGVVSRREREYAGTASLEQKTLHRVLNDLVATWEGNGVEEFLLLTVHGFGPHISAIATVVSERARIRAVDIHSLDLSRFLEESQAEGHAGELETSLLLHLAPDLVDRDAAQDAPLEAQRPGPRVDGEEPVPAPGTSGVVGRPSLATAEKGRRVWEHLVSFLEERLLAGGAP